MIAASLVVAFGQMGFGPLSVSPDAGSRHPNAGWVLDHGAF
jgi:hypothetical protein